MARYLGYTVADGAPALGNMIHAGVTSQVAERMGSALGHGGNLITAGAAEWIQSRAPEMARDIATANASNPQFMIWLNGFLSIAAGFRF